MGVNIWATCPYLGDPGLGGRAGFRFLPRGLQTGSGGPERERGRGPCCTPSGGPRRGASSPQNPRSWPRRAAGSWPLERGRAETRCLRFWDHLLFLLRPRPPAARARESAARGAAFVGAGLGATRPGGRPRPSRPPLPVPAQTAEKMRANCILHFCAT